VVLADLQGKGHVRQRKHFAVLNFGSFFQEKERRWIFYRGFKDNRIFDFFFSFISPFTSTK